MKGQRTPKPRSPDAVKRVVHPLKPHTAVRAPANTYTGGPSVAPTSTYPPVDASFVPPLPGMT